MSDLIRYSIKIHPDAEQDIEEIEAYISSHIENPIAANKIVLSIRQKINSLCFAPERNRIKGRLFSLKVKNYRIYYIVEDQTVYILRVLYAFRNFPML